MILRTKYRGDLRLFARGLKYYRKRDDGHMHNPNFVLLVELLTDLE